ncbi:hypothetical protein JHK85_023557 [Glycine max]|uniref:Uncharacterized protein n=2 Tax=Glycine subgen. Soja TaxID=1462606 RepID=A0A0R0IUR5_SOYBN|nr:hypothetical protein JHK85_023557 [Glycine max]KAG5027170.1 hypothetical protein JHK86_023084 [Glycine max]RZB99613.1 hypothetical protein D0Y65_022153 [Glycine soja]
MVERDIAFGKIYITKFRIADNYHLTPKTNYSLILRYQMCNKDKVGAKNKGDHSKNINISRHQYRTKIHNNYNIYLHTKILLKLQF